MSPYTKPKIAQFHRKYPGAAHHINVAIFDSIPFTRADLATSWQSSHIVRPHFEGGNVRGHPSISLPPLSSPTLPLFICISPTPLYYLQGPYLQSDDSHIQRSDNFLDVDSPKVVDFPLLRPLVPQQHRTSLRCIGTGPHDTTAPSAIMWIPIYWRLGTRRLGTVFLYISFVV
jgi:hypothetical protein